MSRASGDEIWLGSREQARGSAGSMPTLPITHQQYCNGHMQVDVLHVVGNAEICRTELANDRCEAAHEAEAKRKRSGKTALLTASLGWFSTSASASPS
jgi:hypothetical protein